jgi:hypothetical protein
MKKQPNTASAIGDSLRGFPLSNPDDLPNAFDPAVSGQKVNCGQYLTTGHLFTRASVSHSLFTVKRKENWPPLFISGTMMLKNE